MSSTCFFRGEVCDAFAPSTPAAESHDALLLAPSTRCMRLCLNLLMAAIASALAGPPSKVKLVAFDLDGTLLNTDH